MEGPKTRKGSGIACLSISIISDEYQNEINGKVLPEGRRQNSEGPSNATESLEYVVDSQEHLCAEEESPQMLTQVLGASIVALSHLGTGSLMGFPGVTLPQLTQSDSDDIYLSPDNAALFGSLANIGGAVGSIITGPPMVRFGQRLMLLVALPTSLLFWLLHSYSPNIHLLLLSRFVLGLMIGLASTAASTYVMEIAHKDHRGVLFSIVPFFRQFGYFFIYSIANSSLYWRQLSLICAFASTLPSFVRLFFLPNSPRWLITRGRTTDAEKSLIFFRGPKYNTAKELKDIVAEVQNLQSTKNSLSTQLRLLKSKPVLPKFLIAFCIVFLGTFNGSYVIVTYLVPIFEASTMVLDAYISAILIGTIRMIGVLLNMVIIDRFGRRPLHITSYLICAGCLAILGTQFYAVSQDWDVTAYSWVPLVTLLIYTLSFSISVPVQGLLRGELLPNSVRSTGCSILTAVMFTGGFFVTQIYPQTKEAVGEHGAFWLYSAACAIMAMFSFFLLPETSGRSLEEITSDKKTPTGAFNTGSS